MNAALTFVGFMYRSIHHIDHHRRNVDARAITFDERDDGVKRNIQGIVSIDSNGVALRRNLDVSVHEAGLRGFILSTNESQSESDSDSTFTP